MDPTVTGSFMAGFAALGLSMAQQHQERLGRQSDASQLDNRGLTAAVFKAVTESDMGEEVANLNTASHVPTTQPWMAPPWVYTAAPQPAVKTA